ncbi:unnamed protein product [Symbiodinium natans]|uniref:Uncharacterized protein n=1 Tax=Symbiodinium natans TaxID=878477 RepID=A0A812V3Y2_9DINO|nr:unnamed protein product [Symbiodinium natans]
MAGGITPAKDVAEVISTLLSLVEEEAAAGNPNGLFYALYTQVADLLFTLVNDWQGDAYAVIIALPIFHEREQKSYSHGTAARLLQFSVQHRVSILGRACALVERDKTLENFLLREGGGLGNLALWVTWVTLGYWRPIPYTTIEHGTTFHSNYTPFTIHSTIMDTYQPPNDPYLHLSTAGQQTSRFHRQLWITSYGDVDD